MSDAQLHPYLLIREAGIGYEAVRGLRAQGATALADGESDMKGQLDDLAARLCDSIHAAVPAMTAASRRDALRVRRALFNARPIHDEQLRGWMAALPAAVQQDLRTVSSLWRQITQAHAAGAEMLREEVAASRKHLQGYAGGDALLRGIQLSGENILSALDRFQQSAEPSGKRDRRTERTLLGYVIRMALKPSPFGSFTEVRLAVPDARPGGGPDQVTRVVRLNRLVTVALEHALLADPDSRERAVLRLNSTAVVESGRVRYFSRGPDGTPGLMRAERFGELPLTRPLRALLEVLHNGSVVFGELLATAAPEQRPAWRRLVEQLIRSGLVECDLGIPDQEPAILAALARSADALGTSAGERVAAAARRLAGLESAFADQPPSGRARILRETKVLLKETTAGLPSVGLDLDSIRTLVFEDVGGGQLRHMDDRAWQRYLPELGLLQRLLPLFSDTLPGQAALAGLFLEEFGPGGSPDLVEAYRWYRGVPATAIDEFVRSGRGGLAELLALRTEFFGHLDALAEAEAEADLDPAVLAGLAVAIPAQFARWRYASWNVQIASAGDPVLVINGVGMGYARQFGRFCPLFEGESGNALVEAIRASYVPRPGEPVPVDILGTFGINVNIRPRLLPGALLYPGSKGDGLSLRDCFASYDEETGRVRVVSRALGCDIVPVPQNPLFLALAPPLFQFLAQLGPGDGTTLPIWDRYHAARGAAQPRRYPRLRLGRTVVQRATWKLDAGSVPETAGAAHDFRAFTAARQWWRAQRLPDAVFARMHVLADPLSPHAAGYSARNELAAARLRRPLERKPQFIDATSPLILSMLSSVANGTDDVFTLQEFLPADTGDRAREYIIETRISECARSGGFHGNPSKLANAGPE